MRVIFIVSFAIILFNKSFSQDTLYYNHRGEITLNEFSDHFRVANINIEKKCFIGNVIEYRNDSSLMFKISYNNSGKKTGLAEYILSNNDTLKALFRNDSLIGKTNFPDSILNIIKVKEGFKKATYIRKNDYSLFKELLIDTYDPVVKKVSLENGKEAVYTIVEDQPDFPGGMSQFANLLGYFLGEFENPDHKKTKGKVYVKFIVNEDGTISDIEVLKGIGGGCDEAAVKAMSKMPDWNPGYQRGNPVKVRMVIPITFK